jgi:hypothetical protein
MKKLQWIIFLLLIATNNLTPQNTQSLKYGYYQTTEATILVDIHDGYHVICDIPKNHVVRLTGKTYLKDYYVVWYNTQRGYLKGSVLKPTTKPASYSNPVTLEDKIRSDVSKEFNNWILRGEFEKSIDYEKRVSQSNQELKIKQLTDEAVEKLQTEYINNLTKNINSVLHRYDADNEVYKISFQNKHEIFLPVPISEAPSLKNDFSKVIFNDIELIISNNEWLISRLSVRNPVNGHVYKYKIENESFYQSVDQFNILVTEIDVQVPDANFSRNQDQPISTKTILVGKPDIDVNIPINLGLDRSNTYCLIIGNEDYSTYQKGLSREANVLYANNDAKVFYEYANKTLGIPEKNTTLLLDATSSQMHQAIEKMNLLLKYSFGKGELVFYYAGHGFPDEITKKPYLMPVDANSSNLNYAISLQEVLDKLSIFPAQKVTVFLDACFSGGARNQTFASTRGVKITPKMGQVKGNMVVFASSSESQTSGVFEEKQHGVFTYFLLKKIQESNGDATYQELFNYISSKVPTESILVNNFEQIPVIYFGTEITDKWGLWKLK